MPHMTISYIYEKNGRARVKHSKKIVKDAALGEEPKVDSLRERVYQYLKDAMSAGKLRYGEFLDQDSICETLEVSKTPLRDALIRLEAEGFVTILPRKGVYINPISLDFIKSAYQIIGSIEADCLNEVFNKLTAYHVRQFEASNERQWELLKNNDYTEYYDENIRFHGIFLSLSENILLEQTLIPLRRRLYDFPRRQYSYEWESMNLYTHQRFIDSVKLGVIRRIPPERKPPLPVIPGYPWHFLPRKRSFETARRPGFSRPSFFPLALGAERSGAKGEHESARKSGKDAIVP